MINKYKYKLFMENNLHINAKIPATLYIPFPQRQRFVCFFLRHIFVLKSLLMHMHYRSLSVHIYCMGIKTKRYIYMIHTQGEREREGKITKRREK